MFSLKPHSSNSPSGPELYGEVLVELEVTSQKLVATMSAPMLEEPNLGKNFDSSHKNWGLWEHDVFEMFLTRHGQKAPYLELQVSPLNQKFALLVKRPREQWSYPESDPFVSESKLEEGLWKCSFEVPLKNVPGGSPEIYGNFHLIIGAQRRHYSLNPNDGEKPDFHRPDLFVKLAELKLPELKLPELKPGEIS